jgi:hypothetical protein
MNLYDLINNNTRETYYTKGYYIENVFGRQRRHRALQPVAVEWVVWIHSIYKNKPNFKFCKIAYTL